MQLWNTETNSWNFNIGGILSVTTGLLAMLSLYFLIEGIPLVALTVSIWLSLGAINKVNHCGDVYKFLLGSSGLGIGIAIAQQIMYGTYMFPLWMTITILIFLNIYASYKKEVR